MNYTGKGLVCFDMDMTLLDHRDWKIPDSARKAVELLRENYYIAIATGRDMDAKYSEGLSEQVQPDGIIHLNGTKVTVDGEMIYEHRMSRDLVERILKFSQGQDFAVGISVGAEDYFMNPEYVTRHDIIRWGQSNRCFRDPWKLLEISVRTMAYIGEEPGAKRMEEAFPELKLPMFSSRKGADVVEKSVSKAEGMKQLCSYFGVPLSCTVAFGDSMNDYEMIQMAKIGIAMGNSVGKLKEAADYVTSSIGEDGIWSACEYFGLF